MDSNKLIDAVRTIRKELLIKDEVLKAYNLLKEINLPELDEELKNTYGMLRPLFEPDEYKRIYDCRVDDAETIEPKEVIKHAEKRYDRYAWMVREMELEKPTTYLDLACYIGSLVTTGASRGIKSYGVDMTKHSIEIARRRAKESDLEHLTTFFVDDVVTFDKVKADLVSAFEVLEHVPDPEKFIKRLCSLANKWVYITTPHGSYDNGVGNLGHWEWDKNPNHTRGHVRVFTKESLFRLLNDCGCEIAFLDSMPDKLLWAKFRGVEK